MKKTIELSLEKAQELYSNGGEDIKNLLLSTFSKKELEKTEVKCWEDLKSVDGFYIDRHSRLCSTVEMPTSQTNRNIWATQDQAIADREKSQLSQLLKDVNGEWVPDWTDSNDKYAIYYYKNEIDTSCLLSHNEFLAFPTREIRDTFLENHRELIEIAKPLL